MKQQQFFITLGLSALSLLLCFWVIVQNSANRSSQRKYQETLAIEQQKKAPEIQKGPAVQQIGTAIIKDMGEAALKNEKMKLLLKNQGINVHPNPTPVPATGESEGKPAEKSTTP